MDAPSISIIMASYNRAHSINRAIDSVLRQTFKNFELIVIDDGSIDNTLDVLAEYTDPRIRVVKHIKNKGVTAAKNSGFDEILGEWFTLLDSDDEMLPEALETLMGIPINVDNQIDAVTCNCVDSVTGKFSGHGLDGDQYLDETVIATRCRGEFWGLTKTALLQGDRLNEKLPGWENTLWYKINARAHRYYIHKALRIYHTEGDDRITKKDESKSVTKKENQAAIYKALMNDGFFLGKTAQFNPNEFTKLCVKAIATTMAVNDKDTARFYYGFICANSRRMGLDKIIASSLILGGRNISIAAYWAIYKFMKLKNMLAIGR